jgi:uncharacterized protein
MNMNAISLLIKPVSSNCNLNCNYCFYNSIAEKRTVKSYGLMKTEMLEIIVDKALHYADKSATFIFQGGEPTLAGLEFYKNLIELEKKYNNKNIKINNVLQTNGVLIDRDWAEFLSAQHFLVGVSLDGTKELHDANRMNGRRKGSFNSVLKTVQLFDRAGVEYNILTVVSNLTARHIHKIYDFYKQSHFRYLQFIPCLDPLGENPGERGYSLTPEKYGNFLKTLFDLWYNDLLRGYQISIRYFDNLINMIQGAMPEACDMSGRCRCQYVIEADGGVYPCDFYATDRWLLGNIAENSIDEFVGTAACGLFIKSSEKLPAECAACRWAGICRGGCRRYREPLSEAFPSLNYYCPSYREFFEYAYDRLIRLASAFSVRP